MILDTTSVRTGYLQRLRTFLDQTAESIREEGGDYVLVRTDSNPAEALGLYLADRERLL